ncbi:MAG: penicillin-binding transpeptidase domain-containing protein [Pseudomonadota bacterium]
MASWFDRIVKAGAARRTAWRRARNARRAGAGRLPVPWLAGAAACVAGAVLIAAHARHLVAAAEPLNEPGVAALDALQPLLPGAVFTVPGAPGMVVDQHAGAALLIAAGMHAEAPLHIDLCAQLSGRTDAHLLPVRIGAGFGDVARWVAMNREQPGKVGVRNIVLAGPGAADMPQVQVHGNATTLQVGWDGRDVSVRWLGDASGGRLAQGARGQVPLLRDGWLVWNAGALRIQRRASASCAQAGELLVQLFRADVAHTGRAQVIVYPERGAPQSLWLAAGRYTVPLLPRPALEDQALFRALQAHGLVRLGGDGQAELAPSDLAAWQVAASAARATPSTGWDAVLMDAAARKLLQRLYRMADGDYVRAQVQVFNSERRLLAWRTRPGSVAGDWQVTVGAAPVGASVAMPPGAARLFAELAQGWSPWARVASWPQGGAARLTLSLAQPAAGGELLHLMLIGRPGAIAGARLRAVQALCTGRACPMPEAVQQLTLELAPGARMVAFDVVPLELPYDAQYRHLRLVDGKLDWQPLASALPVPRAALAGVTLEDRNGVLLWSDGAASAAARAAGLAPLLGLGAGHTASVAGMLARVATPSIHHARLTLDLALQAASQQALECVGMRRGRWDGKACSGGQAAPAGRRAGLVVLDAENGDVLAAAGAGAGEVDPANWAEVRDFDRANPARSALRLPALQHDGGAHQSPGSTFKIVSALGLELAAQRDRRLDALLAGMPLAAINRLARQDGFAFQTDAAVYPMGTTLAHITNYKEQVLDRRAQDGRLGLAQALSFSLNTWFAWSSELSDRSLFGRPDGGAPDLQALEQRGIDPVRPIVAMAHRLGFEQALRLDGGLLPADFAWSAWDALQTTPAHIDPIHSRHELRQMAIGLRMQATPLQMALAAGAVGQGGLITPRLLLQLDGRAAAQPAMAPLGVRLDRIRAGMKGVVDAGTAATAFRGAALDDVRRGLSGKTGTAPSGDSATVWFAGWLEAGSLPGQRHRLALAAFVSHSQASGGDHAAPIVAALLAALAGQNPEQRGNPPVPARLAAAPSMASSRSKIQ